MGVKVTVGVPVGVQVKVGVAVGVQVDVAVGVLVDVPVEVPVEVGVAVGVQVGVAVGVRVGVAVSVEVEAILGVMDGVGDTVGVSVCVPPVNVIRKTERRITARVLEAPLLSPNQTATSWVPEFNTALTVRVKARPVPLVQRSSSAESQVSKLPGGKLKLDKPLVPSTRTNRAFGTHQLMVMFGSEVVSNPLLIQNGVWPVSVRA